MTCTDCGRTLYRAKTPPESRPAGAVVHAGHGRCSTCRQRAIDTGRLVPNAHRGRQKTGAEDRACSRCGIRTCDPDLCVDCQDVIADLAAMAGAAC